MTEIKCVEPVKRMVGGRYGWAVHRFPIKGGKTFMDTVWKEGMQKIAANVTKDNHILSYLKKQRT